MDGYLLGEESSQIEDRWQTMYRGGFYRGGPVLMSAIVGIDQALWDVKGKYTGEPVSELLGGRTREHVPLYKRLAPETIEEVPSLVDVGSVENQNATYVLGPQFRNYGLAATGSRSVLDQRDTVDELARSLDAPTNL